jgi:subtilisin family serine protease
LDRVTKRRPELSGMARRVGTGRGVAIYVFDGGVATDHPELIGRVRIGFDAFPSNPRLCNAHGTAVAGAAAGATLGVAPGAEIVDVKIINCAKNVGSIDAIVAAARWTAEDHRRHPGQPAVVNWSFVVDTSRVVPGIDTAVAILRDAGLLVVGSAGNLDIDACRVSPANSGGILVVGASALTQDTTTAGQVGRSAWRDVRARNTAWGRCIDVYAPGESVLLPNLEGDKPTTSLWDGTSMATGYVSGAASLVLERIPTAAPGDVARIIAEAATEIAVDERINVVGPARARHSRLLYVGPR